MMLTLVTMAMLSMLINDVDRYHKNDDNDLGDDDNTGNEKEEGREAGEEELHFSRLLHSTPHCAQFAGLTRDSGRHGNDMSMRIAAFDSPSSNHLISRFRVLRTVASDKVFCSVRQIVYSRLRERQGGGGGGVLRKR